jgi:hypothetical protein
MMMRSVYEWDCEIFASSGDSYCVFDALFDMSDVFHGSRPISYCFWGVSRTEKIKL